MNGSKGPTERDWMMLDDDDDIAEEEEAERAAQEAEDDAEDAAREAERDARFDAMTPKSRYIPSPHDYIWVDGKCVYRGWERNSKGQWVIPDTPKPSGPQPTASPDAGRFAREQAVAGRSVPPNPIADAEAYHHFQMVYGREKRPDPAQEALLREIERDNKRSLGARFLRWLGIR